MRRSLNAYRRSFQRGSAAAEFIVIAALLVLLIVLLLGAARGLYARLGLLTVAADCATAQMHRQDLGFAMQSADSVAAAYGLAGMYNSLPISRMGCFAISGSSPADPWGTFSYQIHMPHQRYQSDWEAGR
jgi:hypothetical protein